MRLIKNVESEYIFLTWFVIETNGLAHKKKKVFPIFKVPNLNLY